MGREGYPTPPYSYRPLPTGIYLPPGYLHPICGLRSFSIPLIIFKI
jgi:hypothetical protein